MSHETPNTSEEASPAPAPSFPVETGQRLSKSLLWKLQRRYFDQAGIEAWRTTTVPHYVTNNPAFAHAYAEVFLGFLRDCRAAPSFDPTEPVTLVELGTGSGRFAYLFLKALLEMHKRSAVADVRFRYVMTDFTETNVRYWQQHAWLRPFVEQGVLDFAVFDAERDTELRLTESGSSIRAGDLKNPLGVIANYVFDGISQDAFSFEGGRLYECLVSLSASEPFTHVDEPGLLDRLTVTYTQQEAANAYYGDPELDELLQDYARSQEGLMLLFPCAAIRCIRRLAELANGRLLLLSADYGATVSAGMSQAPGLASHGSVSLPVNYHAIAEWVLKRGGDALKTAHHHAHLAIAAFLLGEHPADHGETRLAYQQAIEQAGPDDWFALRIAMREGLEQIGLQGVLSLIRLSYWDPRTLQECLPALWNFLETAQEPMLDEVMRAALRTWENYYPIGEDVDFAFQLGLLAYVCEAYSEGLALFGESVRLYGDDPRTRWNMGLCHWGLGEYPEALQQFGEAARLEPEFKLVGGLQVK
jgi:tetratricopeptide (TPR) repeat protein